MLRRPSLWLAIVVMATSFVFSTVGPGAQAWDSPSLSYVTGGTTGQDVGRGVAVDASGNIYLAGQAAASTGALPFSVADSGQFACTSSPCNRRVFVTRLSPTGQVDWLRLFDVAGTSTSVDGLGLDASGNLYMAGAFTDTLQSGGLNLSSGGVTTSAGFVIKMSTSDGSIGWMTPIVGSSGGNVEVAGFDVDPQGNMVVTGTASERSISLGTLTLPSVSSSSGFAFRLHADGSPSWGVRIGGGLASSVAGNGASIAPNGDIYVVGSALGTVSISATYFPGGGLTGSETPLTPGTVNIDAFVAKFSTNGVVETNGWPVRFSAGIGASSLSVDADENTVAVASEAMGALTVGGTTFPPPNASNNDVTVLAFETNGTLRWQYRIEEGSTGSDKAREVMLLANGDLVTTGSHKVGAVENWFVSRHTAQNGTMTWFKKIGAGAGPLDIGQALTTDCLGNIYSVGRFDGGQVDPNDATITATPRGGGAQPDALLVKLRFNGSLAPSSDPHCVAPLSNSTAAPITAFFTSALDVNGGACTGGHLTGGFIGFTYLPGPSDCSRAGYTFGGWANTTTPTVARSFPLLTDPSDGQRRYFVAENVNLVALWTPVASPPASIINLSVFANFLCGPCTTAWLLFTTPSDATDFAVSVNGTAATCAQKGTFFGLSLCELKRLAPGATTFTVTPTSASGSGPPATVTITLRR